MAEPYRIAEETFVIPGALPVPGIGWLPVNAMVIRGAQPMIVDTLAIVQREEFLEGVFSLLDPEEVRWLFLSHEDRDHSGSVMEVLERCPNAKLVTNFLGLGKLSEEFSIPPERVHMLNDGESLDIGDRTVTALRPPLYDSSATRGLWDPATEVYFSADCFGAVGREPVQYTDELADADLEDGYFWMNRANHIWFQHIRPDSIEAAAKRISDLGMKTLVSGHGPTERQDPERLCRWITRIADMDPVPMPDQAEFERLLAEEPPAGEAAGPPG